MSPFFAKFYSGFPRWFLHALIHASGLMATFLYADEPAVAQESAPWVFSGDTTHVESSQTIHHKLLFLKNSVIKVRKDAGIHFSGSLEGKGGLVKQGEGGCCFSGSGLFEGPLEVAEGGLTIGGTICAKPQGTTRIAGECVLLAGASFVGALEVRQGGALSIRGQAAMEGSLTMLPQSQSLFSYEATANLSLLSIGNGARVDFQDCLKPQRIYRLEGDGLSQLALKNSYLQLGSTQNSVFKGNISGSGLLEKIGSGRLSLEGTSSSFDGIVTIKEGTLSMEHNLTGYVAIARHARLEGNGRPAKIFNEGVFAPSHPSGGLYRNDYEKSSARTLAIEVNSPSYFDQILVTGFSELGEALDFMAISGVEPPLYYPTGYEQSSTGILEIEVGSPVNFDQILVNGVAELAGSLDLMAISGVETGFSYPIIEASDGVIGSFEQVLYAPPAFNPFLLYSIDYADNNVTVAFQNLLPVSSSILTANQLSLAENLFCPDAPSVVNELLDMPSSEFVNALNYLTFGWIGAPAILSDHNESLISGLCLDPHRLPNDNRRTHLWMAPLGSLFAFSQQSAESLPEGYSKSLGAVVGVEQGIGASCYLGCGWGYLYSDLNWDNNYGNFHSNAFYFMPYLKYGSWLADINILFSGAMNGCKSNRLILFPGVDQVAHADFAQYQWGTLITMGKTIAHTIGARTISLTPSVEGGYNNCYQTDISENGAQSLDLNLASHRDQFLRCRASLLAGAGMVGKRGSVLVDLLLGYLYETTVDQEKYEASFQNVTLCTPQFFIQSFSLTKNSMVVGGSLRGSWGCFEGKFKYETQMGIPNFKFMHSQAFTFVLEASF